MKISVILGHPNKDSFNHAIANTVVETLLKNGHDVIFHDLYKENFDPITTAQEIRKGASLEKVIEEHCKRLVKQKESSWTPSGPRCYAATLLPLAK